MGVYDDRRSNLAISNRLDSCGTGAFLGSSQLRLFNQNQGGAPVFIRPSEEIRLDDKASSNALSAMPEPLDDDSPDCKTTKIPSVPERNNPDTYESIADLELLAAGAMASKGSKDPMMDEVLDFSPVTPPAVRLWATVIYHGVRSAFKGDEEDRQWCLSKEYKRGSFLWCCRAVCTCGGDWYLLCE